MPAQPLWISRLPAIRQQVLATDGRALWDRAAVEALFGLRRRQAITLLHAMRAEWIGGNLAIGREELLRFLAEPRRCRAALEEQERESRLASALGHTRGESRGLRILIPLPAEPDRINFAGLPAGIELQRGQLRIVFDTPAGLLEKLVALAQAMMNDYDTFEEKLQAAGEET